MEVIEAMTLKNDVPLPWSGLRAKGETLWRHLVQASIRSNRIGALLSSTFLWAIRRIISARAFWLFAAELAGVVLVSYGISLWSIPAALIIGGLVMVAAVEVRPHVGQRLPSVPPPVELLRSQAESAAVVINSDRYGLGAVDTARLADLTPAECERLILAARAIGARNALRAREASSLAGR